MTDRVDLTEPQVDAAISRLAREESGRVLALLARRYDDLDLADDAVQEALLEAIRTWPTRGIPGNPAGWLMSVANRKAIDRTRRAASAYRRTLAAAPDIVGAQSDMVGSSDDEQFEFADDRNAMTVTDEHLRLVLLCCHPALDVDTQVALTLRLVGGLTTPEIASAFLIPEATLAQRIVRAKRKIRDAGIPLRIPVALDERIGALLAVIYLIFNEGYLSHSADADMVRVDLVEEAIRLTRLVLELLPDHPEVEGLLALELFNASRLLTRTDAANDLVLLEDQDRSRWDLEMISQANAVLYRAMGRMHPGPYQLQALIASQHANARTATETDWPAIAGLYRQLLHMTGSPVVGLNHAVAVAMADGPHAGLALLDGLTGLDRYHLFHSARAELCLRADDLAGALASFKTARTLTGNAAEQRHLERRVQHVRRLLG